jgi:hypothetical protein
VTKPIGLKAGKKRLVPPSKSSVWGSETPQQWLQNAAAAAATPTMTSVRVASRAGVRVALR